MDLLLHTAVYEALRPEQFAAGKTYLFVGRPGQGRRAAAKELARELNCLHKGEPCAHCRLFAKDSFPDFICVAPDGQSVKIEQIRALQSSLSLSPYGAASARFAVIDEAESLTIEAQNALLKLIEEPPAQTTMVLVATDPEALLPTVRSRAQVIYFPPVPLEQVTEWLAKQNARPAKELAELSEGAPGLAMRLAGNDELRTAYQSADQTAATLYEQPLFDRLVTIKELVAAPESLQLVADRVIARARLEARRGNSTALPSAERLMRHLSAGVVPRAAFEAFAVGV
jgi:DNA polymerase III delta' subunit